MRKISKALTIAMVLLLVAPNICAQDKTKKIKVYKIWVTKMDGSKVKGFFYAADEQGITISKSKVQDESNLLMVEAANISLIKIRRKGAVGKGAGIGFLSGAAFGAIMGYAAGDDEFGWFSLTKEDKASVGAISFGVVGTGVGALWGTGKMKIPIDGNAETYITQLKSLTNYTIKQD
jgi:hypothetical protein